MEPPQLRLTLSEVILVFVAAVAGLFVGGGVLYAMLGVWALPLVQVLFIAGPVFIAASGRGSVRLAPRLAGFTTIPWTAALGAALVGASFWYLEIRLLVPISDRWLGGQETSEAIRETLFPGDVHVGVLIAMVAVFPGVCEELLFRGALLRGLYRRTGPIGAVVLSALLFALIHVYPAQMLPVFTLGLVLGTLVVRTGSVVTSMIVHVIHNAMVAAVSLEAWPAAGALLEQHPDATLAGSALLSGAGFLLILTKRTPS